MEWRGTTCLEPRGTTSPPRPVPLRPVPSLSTLSRPYPCRHVPLRHIPSLSMPSSPSSSCPVQSLSTPSRPSSCRPVPLHAIPSLFMPVTATMLWFSSRDVCCVLASPLAASAARRRQRRRRGFCLDLGKNLRKIGQAQERPLLKRCKQVSRLITFFPLPSSIHVVFNLFIFSYFGF